MNSWSFLGRPIFDFRTVQICRPSSLSLLDSPVWYMTFHFQSFAPSSLSPMVCTLWPKTFYFRLDPPHKPGSVFWQQLVSFLDDRVRPGRGPGRGRPRTSRMRSVTGTRTSKEHDFREFWTRTRTGTRTARTSTSCVGLSTYTCIMGALKIFVRQNYPISTKDSRTPLKILGHSNVAGRHCFWCRFRI